MLNLKISMPSVIIIAGIAAVGKSTFSKILVRSIDNCVLLDKDSINESFLSTSNTSGVGSEIYRLTGAKISKTSNYYKTNVRLQSYQCMLRLAKDNLDCGKSVILDGNYVNEIRQGYLETVLFPFFEGIAKIKLVYVYADERVIKQRMIQRNASRDTEKIKSKKAWRLFLKEQPLLPPELEKYEHIKINTDVSLEQNIQIVGKYICNG